MTDDQGKDAKTTTDDPRGIDWIARLLIIVVVVIGYGFKPAALPLVGEETCRANHGVEMAASGDWLIATQQGLPILDRPPLQYWTFAAIHKYIHPLDPLTLRVTMVVVLIITALVVHWYSRRFVGPTAAFLAGVAYPTMGHVFELGRRVETDGLFALLLASAVLVWHAGYSGSWSSWRTWLTGCGVAALAALCKGIQAPVAFFGAVYLYLLLRRDWKSLFSMAHAAGVVFFLAIIAVWQAPFFLEAGWEGTRSTWLDPGASRLEGSIGGTIAQLIRFPIMVVGATLPWSILLFAPLLPGFWRMRREMLDEVMFIVIAMLAIFGPVWISPDGHHRYVMPMYPLIAVFAGVAADRTFPSLDSARLRRAADNFARIVGVTAVLTPVIFAVVSIVAGVSDVVWARMLAQPAWMLVTWMVLSFGAAVFTFRRYRSNEALDRIVIIFIAGAQISLVYGAPIQQAHVYKAEAVGPAVQEVRAMLPEETTLVSFGAVHHKFVYWYEEPIPILPRTPLPEDIPEALEYFALDVFEGEIIALPFEWEELRRLNMDRTRQEEPEMAVIIGRRLAPRD